MRYRLILRCNFATSVSDPKKVDQVAERLAYLVVEAIRCFTKRLTNFSYEFVKDERET